MFRHRNLHPQGILYLGVEFKRFSCAGFNFLGLNPEPWSWQEFVLPHSRAEPMLWILSSNLAKDEDEDKFIFLHSGIDKIGHHLNISANNIDLITPSITCLQLTLDVIHDTVLIFLLFFQLFNSGRAGPPHHLVQIKHST